MRLLSFSTVLTLLITSATLSSLAHASKFSVNQRNSKQGDPASWTKAQQYAHELTRRKPTRRQTAQRRQVSEIPRRRRDLGLSVVRPSDGTHIGFMAMRKASPGALHRRSAEQGPTPSFNTHGLVSVSWDKSATNSDKELSFSVASTAGVSPTNSHRIVMHMSGSAEASLVSEFPILGLVQCSTSVLAGSPVGPGFNNYLCVTGIADPGAAPIRLPTLLPNAVWHNGAAYPAEIDVWDVDIDAGVATAHWVNADGTIVPLCLLAHPESEVLYATGDVNPFRAEMGAGFEIVELKI